MNPVFDKDDPRMVFNLDDLRAVVEGRDYTPTDLAMLRADAHPKFAFARSSGYTTKLEAIRHELHKFGEVAQAYGCFLAEQDRDISDEECDQRWAQYDKALYDVFGLVEALDRP